TDRFDNDVGVAREHVFEARGPDDVAAQRRTARRRLSIRQRVALGKGAAIEDVGQLETGDGIRTGEAYGDRGTDGAEAEDGDATELILRREGRAASGRMKRIDDAHAPLIFPVDPPGGGHYFERSVRLQPDPQAGIGT